MCAQPVTACDVLLALLFDAGDLTSTKHRIAVAVISARDITRLTARSCYMVANRIRSLIKIMHKFLVVIT